MRKTGDYRQQPQGYQAFIPFCLPPRESLKIDGKMQLLLAQANLAVGRLDGCMKTVQNPDWIIMMYLRKEAVLSSRIEGTQSSLQDVLVAEVSKQKKGDAREVLNYLFALKKGLELLKKLPLSLRFLRDIHKRLMRGVRGGEKSAGKKNGGEKSAGEFRKSQNWIGGKEASVKEAAFIPPPPAEMMKALAELETFLHQKNKMSPLIEAGLVHAQFETIHPFLDGNGRLGRLLVAFLWAEREILQYPVLYLSDYFNSNRQEYYQWLQRTRTHGDWEGWLEFFLKGVCKVAEDSYKTAIEIVNMRERNREAVLNNRSGVNGSNLLELLYQHPIVSALDIANKLRVSTPTSHNMINLFVELGLLKEITGHKRNRQFCYQGYIDLFS